MQVLITGGAGFLGSSIADALIEAGHEVTVYDNLSTGRRSNVTVEAHLIEGDIRAFVPNGKWDVIYHCAASYKDRAEWERDASTNVNGTINVVREAQRSGAKIVYFQTSLCYGPKPESPITLDSPLAPQGSYAVSKTAGERYIADSGVPFVSLRLANIYGPRNLSGPVPTFYQRITAGQTCTVVDSRRDFVFVDDLVEIAVQAGQKGQGIYHVSTGADWSIKDLYWLVVRAMGIAEDLEPTEVARGADDVATLLLDPTETREEFGWVARTPMWQGVREAVEWYRANGVTEVYTHLAQKG